MGVGDPLDSVHENWPFLLMPYARNNQGFKEQGLFFLPSEWNLPDNQP